MPAPARFAPGPETGPATEPTAHGTRGERDDFRRWEAQIAAGGSC